MTPVIAFKPGQSAGSRSVGAQEEVGCTLEGGGGGNNKQAFVIDGTLRRMTPLESERMQGFPDNYTDICATDGQRYRATGNSMAVPVMQLIGNRIHEAMQEGSRCARP